MTKDNTKHTHGPWTTFARLSGSENHKGFYVVSASDWPLCDVMPVDQDGIEGEANAHLIAAAPELLEALRAVVFAIAPDHDYENIEGFFREPVSQALAAIAKAEGRA